MNETIVYRLNQADVLTLTEHLQHCDAAFLPPLSGRVDIGRYARKLAEHAIRFEAWSGKTLVGLLAVYCNNPQSRSAYISNVSVLPAWAGRGIGTQLLTQCIEHVNALGFRQIRLEVASANRVALGLYQKHGFIADTRQDQAMILHLTLPNGETYEPAA